MRVLVTGGSSLIGAGVAAALLARGDEVVVQQRGRSETLSRLGVRQELGDIRDLDVVLAAAIGCEAIVHLAAKVGVVGDWEDYRSINVDGTRNVLHAAQRNGVGRVVHVSSPSVAHGGEPIVGGGADEPVLGRRRAWYPESKAMAEIDALAAAGDELGVVAIRPHLVWGPGDTQLVGRIVERAVTGRLALVGGGRALVDTTYLDNAVDALVAALDAVEPGARCSGRAYVVSNGEPRMIRELVEGICHAAGVPFEPRTVSLRVGRSLGAVVERAWPLLRRDDEPPLTQFLAEQLGTAHWFDPRPARDDLGWTPVVSIDEGLARLAEWYATDRDRTAP
ncbi:MAG TPA: NAD-dependent epimerase/dehydratase family protein [Ilumatobacteraceae bacterium]|nr:NAD-dependent epimerase/dehydratase family protein [Ilumatobacteraceae bacterium]